MTKAELIQKLAAAMDTTHKEAEFSLNATTATLTEVLVAGESIVLPGFGSFGVKTRAARQGVNPATQAPINIPETQIAYFKVGSKLKDAVANTTANASSKTKTANKKVAAKQTQLTGRQVSGKSKK